MYQNQRGRQVPRHFGGDVVVWWALVDALRGVIVARTPHLARGELSLFSQHQENGRDLTEFVIHYCEWMIPPSTLVGFSSL
jgi:hypothetical protein